MRNKSKISKMFGALVLGGGILVTSTSSAADPAEIPEPTKNKPSEETKESTKEPLHTPRPEKHLEKDAPADHCQLEFTLYKYNRDGAEAVKTCLDDKKDEEILNIIKEAKTKTCDTPFCGCWLG
jgi:hypothetical protein